MTSAKHDAINNLHRIMLSGAFESLAMSREISAELMETIDGISFGNESLLERVGLFVNRNSAEYRFGKLRCKLAELIGKRTALISIGNRYLQARGAETVAMQDDYGLSDCKADRNTGHANTDWSDHMHEAYERMQACIEAVEDDVSKCQERLNELPA